MPKQNTLHSHLYRLLACLSILVLLTGPAAAPADPATPTPPAPEAPTPAQQKWANWSSRGPARTIAERTEQSERPAAPSQPEITTLDNYSSYLYTPVVFSALGITSYWDEEIYMQSSIMPLLYGVRRLTSSPGADFEPRLSGVGQRIVFVSNRNSTEMVTISNIYSMSLTGADVRRLTTTTRGIDRMPSFSPDGKKIVFVSTRDGNAEIYVMNSDGTNQVRLTNSADPDVEPDWSPDGKRIAWVRRSASGTGTLYTMNPNGMDVKAILPNIPFLSQPHWSPSGSRLLFQYDPTADGWLDLGFARADGIMLGQLPVYRHSNIMTDIEAGGWMPDENAFIYNVIEYVYDLEDGKYYIRDTALFQASLPNVSEFFQLDISDDLYTFTPHANLLDHVSPVSRLAPLPEFSHYQNVPITMYLSDDYPGVHTYTVEVLSDYNPSWNLILSQVYDPNYFRSNRTFQYHGSGGDRVSFRINAVDLAGNKETLRAYDAWTRLYEWRAWTRVTDAREQPLSGAQAALNPQAMNQPPTAPDGTAMLYIPRAGNYRATHSKPGYATLPYQTWEMDQNRAYHAVLTGPDEQIENGYFEAQAALAGWQVNGQPVDLTTEGRYGTKSIRLGKPTSSYYSLTDPVVLADISVIPQAIALDGKGRAHILYNDTQYGLLDDQGAITAWPALPEQPSKAEIRFDASGHPYLTNSASVMRWNGTEWTTTTVPLPEGAAAEYGIDGQGRIHVLYSNPALSKTFYMRQGEDGTWPAPIEVNNFANPFTMAVAPDGTAHLGIRNYYLTYIPILPDGTKGQTQYLSSYGGSDPISLHFIPGQGALLIESNPYSWWGWQINGGTPTYLLGSGGGTFAGLQYDTAGNVYVLSHSRDHASGVDGMRVDALYANSTSANYFLPMKVPGSLFEITATGYPRFIYKVVDNTGTRYEYRRALTLKGNEEQKAAQNITLDASMRAPTLSFFYRFASPHAVTKSRFEVTFTPEGGQAVTLFSTSAKTPDWRHAWVDLTPYQGQSGSLAFRVAQGAGEFPSNALVDEVSVSSLPTPLLTDISPRPVAYPVAAGTVIDLYGQNLQLGAQVLLDGQPVYGVEYLDETHLRFQMTTALNLGTHVVTVTNPDGADNRMLLYVGRQAFLPALQR